MLENSAVVLCDTAVVNHSRIMYEDSDMLPVLFLWSPKITYTSIGHQLFALGALR